MEETLATAAYSNTFSGFADAFACGPALLLKRKPTADADGGAPAREVRPRQHVGTPEAPWASALVIKAPRPASSASSHEPSCSTLPLRGRASYDCQAVSSPRCASFQPGNLFHVDMDEQPSTPRASSSGISIFTPTKQAVTVTMSPCSAPAPSFLGSLTISCPRPREPSVSGSFYGVPDRMCSGMASPMMMASPLGPSRLSVKTAKLGQTPRTPRTSTATGGCASPLSKSGNKSPISPGRWVFPGRKTSASPLAGNVPMGPFAPFPMAAPMAPAAAAACMPPPALSPRSCALASPRATRPSQGLALEGSLPKSPSCSGALPGAGTGASPFTPYVSDAQARQGSPAQAASAPVSRKVPSKGQLPAGQRLRALVLVASLAQEHPTADLNEEQSDEVYKAKVAEAFHDWLELQARSDGRP